MKQKVRIQGRVYDVESAQDLTLKDILTIESQFAQLGIPLAWSDLLELTEEFKTLSQDAVKSHPKAPIVIALMVYATRRAAGDEVTVSEAIDFPMSELEFIPLPPAANHPPRARPGKKAQRRKASGRADAPAAQPRPRAHTVRDPDPH